MIEPYEKGSLLETQDAVCIDLAKSIKDWMGSVDSKELLTTSISETMPPNPLIANEHDLTLHYCLKPFTVHSGLSELDAQWMTMVQGEGGPYSWEVAGLEIVSIPKNEDGEIILPKRFDEWNVLYEVGEYVGVLKPDRTKPSGEEITICRILLEDALTSIIETDSTHTIAA